MSGLAGLARRPYVIVMANAYSMLGAAYRSLGPWLVLAALLWVGAAVAQTRLETFERDSLVIETARGQSHSFDVEVARTPAQQAQGLMYRRSMAATSGMLFVYDRDWPVSMWMKNTLIPLDMVFIARDGRIIHVFERAVPMSLESISAGQPVAGVLELNGGTAARLGITKGGRVDYPAFDGGS